MPRFSGRYPSGQRGQTVNLLVQAFGGSSPPLPTSSNHEGEPGGNSSAVERQPSKLGVAGSNPVSRSRFRRGPRSAGGGDERVSRLGEDAHVAQSAERVLGKDEVSGSIPDMGSIFAERRFRTVNGR